MYVFKVTRVSCDGALSHSLGYVNMGDISFIGYDGNLE